MKKKEKKNKSLLESRETERRDGEWGYENYLCFRDLVQCIYIQHKTPLKKELGRNVTTLLCDLAFPHLPLLIMKKLLSQIICD